MVRICWHRWELSDKLRSALGESFQKLKAEASPASRQTCGFCRGPSVTEKGWKGGPWGGDPGSRETTCSRGFCSGAGLFQVATGTVFLQWQLDGCWKRGFLFSKLGNGLFSPKSHMAGFIQKRSAGVLTCIVKYLWKLRITKKYS